MPNLKQKTNFFEEKILDYAKKSGRNNLPWRRADITPYKVWVSEIMLQQTQVSRVIEYYEKFLKKFPSLQTLAQCSWEDFLPFYQGLGYYARGRNMLKTAQTITKDYKGIFPSSKEALVRLPGIGEYTASAILSFGYNKNTLAWDTNLKRVVGRFFYGSKKAVIATNEFENFFSAPRKKLNAALMDFGASICTTRPKCGNCPLQKKCVYFQNNGKDEAIIKKEKNTFPMDQAQVLLFLHENHKHYFSSNKKKFSPITLPPKYNTRAAIKDFFLQTYHLQLSVRPPHKKIFFCAKPTLLINAQILLGTHQFTLFPKQAVQEFIQSIKFDNGRAKK